LVRCSRSAGSRGEVGGGGLPGEERATGTEERRMRRESRREPSSRRKSQPVFIFTRVFPGHIKTSRAAGGDGKKGTGRTHALEFSERGWAARSDLGKLFKGSFLKQ